MHQPACVAAAQIPGAAPVQWAVIDGEAKTGVSIMYLDEGLDTGDILKVAPVGDRPEETSGGTIPADQRPGGRDLVEAVAGIAAGSAVRHPRRIMKRRPRRRP